MKTLVDDPKIKWNPQDAERKKKPETVYEIDVRGEFNVWKCSHKWPNINKLVLHLKLQCVHVSVAPFDTCVPSIISQSTAFYVRWTSLKLHDIKSFNDDVCVYIAKRWWNLIYREYYEIIICTKWRDGRTDRLEGKRATMLFFTPCQRNIIRARMVECNQNDW